MARPVFKGLRRLNYWEYTPVVPAGFDPEWWRDQQEQAIRLLQTEFSEHVHGPCGAPRCGCHHDPKGIPPEDWGFVALCQCVVRANGGYWRQFPDAVRLYLSLPPHRQREIDRLGYHRGRRSWSTLLDIIERDQEVFRFMVENKLSGGPNEASGERIRRSEKWQQLKGISGNMHPSRLRELYTAYHGHACLLLGSLTLRQQLKRKRTPFVRRYLKLLEGREREYSQQPNPLRQELERRGKLAPSGPKLPTCRDWSEVYAWFALALQNLKRYSQGHPPLSWPTLAVRRRRLTHHAAAESTGQPNEPRKIETVTRQMPHR